MADHEDVLSCLNVIKNQFKGSKDTEELFACIRELLPIRGDLYEVLLIEGDANKFKARIDCNIPDVEGVANFVESYTKRTNETLRKLSPTYPSEKNEYSVCLYYRCQHKTGHQPSMNPKEVLRKKPSKRLKNTNCLFSMVFKLKRIPSDFPCLIDLEWNHNHSVQALQSLSFKDIPLDIRDRIKGMFENGYTPGLAYKEFFKGLKSRCSDEIELHQNMADRSKMPMRRDFNKFYTEFKSLKYGSKNLPTMFAKLKTKVDELKANNKDFSMQFCAFDEDENCPFILSLVTPLMRRVHEMVCTCSLYSIYIPIE